MAVTVKDVDTLQEYIIGVMGRADHHAGNVNEIALALAGAIVWKKDIASIKVMERESETKNVLWVNINGKKYAFVYNHDTGKIDMREKTIQGSNLHEFDNSTSLSTLKNIFDAL
ncbi:hypothetical protein [Halarcobacter anaerophilus]|uniref:Integron cassette protein VCH-CASS1 chain domain-containing protein n=1 Tax=Halarcobacter anaerophilus TaxID=877500 RepID=A0A4V1LQG1_9BACT|nr:hypothetical protein [Halarcobacter anaerophilus]QDF29331.1 hypothetical protein AANAER_1858 [Halarcobacter anaerophilus]RXJ64578.1 hypothetical protein CRV06_01075 [Halarcobacter anaerophilus]